MYGGTGGGLVAIQIESFGVGMVVASDVFPLMHALLTGAGFKKTASVLVKEAKLEPQAFKQEHDLLDVYEFYLTHKMQKTKVPKLSVVDTAKKSPKTKKKSHSSSRVDAHEIKTKAVVKRVTSSSSEEEKQVEKSKTRAGKSEKGTKKLEKNTTGAKKKASSSSDESSDSSEEETQKSIKKTVHANKKKGKAAAEDVSNLSKKRKMKAPAAEKNIKKAKREANSSSEDSSSQANDSSDSLDAESSSSSESDSDSDTSDHEEALKKEAVRRQEAAKAALEWQPKKIEKVDTKVKSAGTPFQRVDGEFWSQKILDDTLRDNSYEGTFGIDGVGVKANNKLIKTRGKDFTKGKNKLKRSTYMCGAISMASNSFKFED